MRKLIGIANTAGAVILLIQLLVLAAQIALILLFNPDHTPDRHPDRNRDRGRDRDGC